MAYAIDAHAVIADLEATGLARGQAESIVAAIVSAADARLTKADLTVALADVARKTDLERFATKADLKEALANHITKEDLRLALADVVRAADLEAAIQKATSKLMAMQSTLFVTLVVVMLGVLRLFF